MTTRGLFLFVVGLVVTLLIGKEYCGSSKVHRKRIDEGDIQLTKEESDRVLGWSSHCCGCTGYMVGSIANAQTEVISSLSAFLYYIPMFQSRRELIVEAIGRSAQDAVRCLTYDINCGCTSCETATDSTVEEGALLYHDCCCDADIIKDIYISQMEALGNLPDHVIVFGDSYITSVITAIQMADDGIVESIKNKYICEMPPDPVGMCSDKTTQKGENCTNPGMGMGSDNGFVCCNQQGNNNFDCRNCNSCEEHFVYHSSCCGGCNETHPNCCKCDNGGNSGDFECVDTPLGDECFC